MILITVGASEYPMDRLLKYIDELCDKKIIDGKDIVAQIGTGKYTPKNYKYFSLIGREEYEIYLNKAEIIITHAGTGSVVPALKKGKKIIVFPRMLEYKEHLDNHQLELAEVFTDLGYILYAKNKEELIDVLENIRDFKPKKFKSNQLEFNEMLIKLIEEME